MSYRTSVRKSGRERYWDSLSIAHKWLWIAATRADELGLTEDADRLAWAGRTVHRMTESLTAVAGRVDAASRSEDDARMVAEIEHEAVDAHRAGRSPGRLGSRRSPVPDREDDQRT